MSYKWWETTFPQGLQYQTIIKPDGNALQLAYGVIGTGKTLILLHGWGTWSYAWRHNIAHLAQHHRVICVDITGYGYSQCPYYPQEIGSQVHEIAAFLQTQTTSEVILVGESLGGLIALAIAQQYPTWVSHLILIAPAIFLEKMPHWSMRWLSYLPLSMLTYLTYSSFIRRILRPCLTYLVYQSQRAIYYHFEKITYKQVDELIEPYIAFSATTTHLVADTQQAAQEIKQHLKNKNSYLNMIKAHLPKTTQPTLLIWGEQDQWFSVNDGKYLQHLLPSAHLLIIPESGHRVAGESAEQVNQAIIDFLANN